MGRERVGNEVGFLLPRKQERVPHRIRHAIGVIRLSCCDVVPERGALPRRDANGSVS